LGGAVQTLPRRDDDPEPPPDNGQHIALGRFSSYLRFLDRIGSLSRVRRLPLRLPVIDERGRVAAIGYGAGPLLRYRHVSPGELHGEAARRALEAAGATVVTGERVSDLDELDADAVVVALPPEESARLLGEPDPGLEPSPIVSVHLLFDRRILRHQLAALLG